MNNECAKCKFQNVCMDNWDDNPKNSGIGCCKFEDEKICEQVKK